MIPDLSLWPAGLLASGDEGTGNVHWSDKFCNPFNTYDYIESVCIFEYNQMQNSSNLCSVLTAVSPLRRT